MITSNFTAYSYKILGTHNLTIHFVVMKIARAIMYKIRGIKIERGSTAEKKKVFQISSINYCIKLASSMRKASLLAI